MQFIPYRMLRNQPGELRQQLKRDGELVVTSNGEPFALMVNIEPGEVEESLFLIAQLRAQQATSAIRAQAREKGLNRLSPEEIEAEIQSVRAGRRET